MAEAACGYIAGLFGGIASLVIGFPLDTIKVNQQSRAKNTPTLKAAKWIFTTKGVSGFFQGITFPMLASGVMNSAFFGTFELCAKRLELLSTPKGEERDNLTEAMLSGRLEHHQFSNQSVLLAGGIAGFTQVLIGCPVELVKIKMQTSVMKEKSLIPNTSLECIMQIHKTHGFRGLFQGCGVMCLREIPSSSIYMFTYFRGSDLVKDTVRKYDLASAATNEKLIAPFLGGGMAGLLSWWLVLPMDVVKSRLQADSLTKPKYKNVWECVKSIKAKEGYRGFVKGFLPLTIRAFPVNGAAFLAYEWFVRVCKHLSQDQH